MNYFDSLFSTMEPSKSDDIINSILTKASASMRDSLDRPYTKVKVEVALNQMKPSKTPGPHGMSSFSYQHYWDMVGNDLSAAVLDILGGSPILEGLNHTYVKVTLIPRKHKLMNVSDFRPIRLSN